MMINVKVRPNARINKLIHETDGTFTIWTTAVPDKGQANVAVIRLLADHLKCSRSSILLKRGAMSRQKVFEVPDTEVL